MSKKQWNECKCGVTTDIDVEECPEQGLENNPREHQFTIVILSVEELRERITKGNKVYIKDHSIF